MNSLYMGVLFSSNILSWNAETYCVHQMTMRTFKCRFACYQSDEGMSHEGEAESLSEQMPPHQRMAHPREGENLSHLQDLRQQKKCFLKNISHLLAPPVVIFAVVFGEVWLELFKSRLLADEADPGGGGRLGVLAVGGVETGQVEQIGSGAQKHLDACRSIILWHTSVFTVSVCTCVRG